MLKQAVLLIAAAFLCAPLEAGTPYVVKDINTDYTSDITASHPGGYTRLDDRHLLFTALSSRLYVTDGTPSGTTLVKEFTEFPYPLRAGNTMFVFGGDAAHGDELWRTDGTPAGTTLVADVVPGPDSGMSRVSIDHGGKLVFGVNGRGVDDPATLWISDGTAAGTKQWFKYIPPGGFGRDIGVLLEFKGRVVAFGYEGAWITDGKSADLLTTRWSYLHTQSPVAVGDRFFFYVGEDQSKSEIWTSDGTKSGTHSVHKAYLGRGVPKTILPLGSRVLFTAPDGDGVQRLWITDGTDAGTQMLGGAGPADHDAVTIGNAAYYTDGNQLWRTDGTAAGTAVYAPGITGVTAMGGAGSLLLFNGHDVAGDGVFVSDTVSGSTHRLYGANGKAMVPESSFAEIEVAPLGNRAVFTGSQQSGDEEPWITDGTNAGTFRLADLGRNGVPSSSPDLFVAAGNTLVFRAVSGESGGEWWRTDGTSDGTSTIDWTLGTDVRSARWNGQTYLAGSATTYRFDEASGTLTLQSFSPNVAASNVQAGADALYLSGNGMFRWLPGETPTSLGNDFGEDVLDYAGRTVLGGPHTFGIVDNGVPSVLAHLDGATRIVTAGGFVYALAAKGESAELWRSEGSAGGTRLLATLPVEVNPAKTPIVAGTRIFFTTDYDGSHEHLYTSDGTAAGTQLVHLVNASQLSGTPTVAPIGNSVLFADDGKLWISDGTADGTKIVKDIAPLSLVSFSGLVYFVATTPEQGTELWQSDGTPAGTMIVSDIEPGSGSSSPQNLKVVGDHLYFSANDSLVGRELRALEAEPYRITIGDLHVAEGQPARFPVTLSRASASRVTVDYATSAVTAAAASDFTASSGTLTFEPGETKKEIAIETTADAIAEENEVFRVALSNAKGAILERATGSAVVEGTKPATDLQLSVQIHPRGSSYVDPVITVRNAGPADLSTAALKLAFVPALTASQYTAALPTGATATWTPAPFQVFGSGSWWASATSTQPDTNAADNIIVGQYSTAAGGAILSYSPAALHPGDTAVLEIRSNTGPVQNPTSSNAAVVTVSEPAATIDQATATLTAHAPGTATITVPNAGTIDVTVLPAGEPYRFVPSMSAYGSTTPVGVPAAFTVNLNGIAPNGAKPAGTITILDGTQLRATTAVTQPITTIVADTGGAGTHTLTVRYSGDANFAPQSTPATAVTSKGTPRLSLHAVALPNGQTEMTVVVTGSPLATPSGYVVIGDTTTIPITLQTSEPGTATATRVVTLAPNQQSIQAVYIGDVNYLQVWQTFSLAPRRHATRH